MKAAHNKHQWQLLRAELIRGRFASRWLCHCGAHKGWR
jgi:hypothetical protein